MTKELKKKFVELDKFWNASDDTRFKGEHPNVNYVHKEILKAVANMDSDEADSLIKELSDEQLIEITGIVQELCEDKPSLISVFKDILSEHDIPGLSEEMKVFS